MRAGTVSMVHVCAIELLLSRSEPCVCSSDHVLRDELLGRGSVAGRRADHLHTDTEGGTNKV
jgi:hypothetical protein